MGVLIFTEFSGGNVFEIGSDLTSTPTPLGGGPLRSPSGPDRDDSGAVVVAEATGDAIALAESGGGWTSFGTSGSGVGQFSKPAAVAFVGGRLVVLDSANHRLVFIDDIGGSGWETYGHPGTSAAGAYATPSGLAVDRFERIWVADPGARRLTRIDGADGSGWLAFPLPDPSSAAPYGLCAYEDGVIVIDVAHRRALVVDDVATVEVPLTAPGWSSPTFVAYGDDGIVVADLLANELRLGQLDRETFVEIRRLRGSPPDVVVPLFDSIGGVGS